MPRSLPLFDRRAPIIGGSRGMNRLLSDVETRNTLPLHIVRASSPTSREDSLKRVRLGRAPQPFGFFFFPTGLCTIHQSQSTDQEFRTISNRSIAFAEALPVFQLSFFRPPTPVEENNVLTPDINVARAHIYNTHSEESLRRVRVLTGCAPEQLVFHNVDLCDAAALSKVLEVCPQFDSCIHFAGLKVWGGACTCICVRCSRWRP